MGHNKGPDRVKRLAVLNPLPGRQGKVKPARALRTDQSFAPLRFLQGSALRAEARQLGRQISTDRNGRNATVCCAAAPCRSNPFWTFGGFRFYRKPPERSLSRRVMKLILLFTSLFAIPLACKGCLDAALLTGLQIVGVTFDFLDDVFRLYLPLEPAQRIFQRFAFLYANLSQNFHLQTCL
jgi:hypothetical protein